MTIDTLPSISRSSATFRADLDAFFLTKLPAFSTQAEAARQEINAAKLAADADVATATVKAADAASAAAAALTSASATRWVTGTNYPAPSGSTAGSVVISPTNSAAYRDTVGGVSSTDPAADTTGRWVSATLPSAEAIGLPNIRPTLLLDFVNSGGVDPRIKVARASAKYAYSPTGAPIALVPNELQVDHNPVSKACRGLRIERATTYLPIESAYASGWGGSDAGGSLVANSATAPDGSTTAAVLTFPSSTSAFAYNARAVTTGSPNAALGAHHGLWIRTASGSASVGLIISNVDVASNAGNAVTVTTEWQYIQHSVAAGVLSNTGKLGIGFSAATSAGVVLRLWHPTACVGNVIAPSYMPTTSSAVTRGEDYATINGADFTDFFNEAEGTFFGAIERVARVDYASAFSCNSDLTDLVMSVGGADFRQGTTSNIDAGVTTAALVTNFACTYTNGGTHSISVNGGAVVTTAGNAGAAPAHTALRLGGSWASWPLDGWLLRFGYIPKRVTDAELLALSTYS